MKEESKSIWSITPIMISVFAIYLCIGMALGVVPTLIKTQLHFSALIIGAAMGIQFIATLFTRAYAGKIADTTGAKTANQYGIVIAIVTGLSYLASYYFKDLHLLALGILFIARILHGISESLAVTGALTWGIGLAGQQNSGKVMTWNGIAMYAGIALGAPLAIYLASSLETGYVFGLMIVLPAISWLCTIKLPKLPIDLSHRRTPFYKVIGHISDQGLALAFSSIGFACISSFITLLFTKENWINAPLAFLTFGGFYILTRVFCASFPDRFGGYKVAMVSFFIEITGQLLIGISSSEAMAIIGCSLTGVGFSLVFPALGVLAIRKVSPQMRGTALGAYTAFFDVSLGIAGPTGGIIALWFGYHTVYFFGAISAALSMLILVVKSKK
ncbi:Predicted arabinose efflux permease, MFS family [Chitinophaga rupis]|uniref:Predicted arabinose efflux permease, MFS family n=1 Tax=Chitinophaga rupis TaxID=573321 RepID=A0A1H7PRQ9_9BACT|nr:MFS transporter [Chitinophaga rupis]SEL38520.1 Predicted arabinose efflux permease, MFS family [Chitinophaga rupis]